MKFPPLGG